MHQNTSCYNIARCGVHSSLALLTMFLSSVIPPLEMLLPMYSGFLIYLASKECGTKWGVLSFLCVSSLSLFISPSKAPVIFFIGLFGYYPIIVHVTENIPVLLRAIIKMAVYNLAAYLYFKLACLMAPGFDPLKMLQSFKEWALPVMAILSNIFLWAYDSNIKMVYDAYQSKFKQILRPTICYNSVKS